MSKESLIDNNAIEINFQIKPTWGGGSASTNSGQGTAWTETIFLGFYASKLKENDTMYSPKTNYNLFTIDACSVKGAPSPKHSIKSNIQKNRINTNNDVCLIPKKYNHLKVIRSQGHVEIYINNKKAIDYYGETIKNPYLAIGSGSGASFYLNDTISIDFKVTNKIKIK